MLVPSMKLLVIPTLALAIMLASRLAAALMKLLWLAGGRCGVVDDDAVDPCDSKPDRFFNAFEVGLDDLLLKAIA